MVESRVGIRVGSHFRSFRGGSSRGKESVPQVEVHLSEPSPQRSGELTTPLRIDNGRPSLAYEHAQIVFEILRKTEQRVSMDAVSSSRDQSGVGRCLK